MIFQFTMPLHISDNGAAIYIYFNRSGTASENIYDLLRVSKKDGTYSVVYKSDVKETERDRSGSSDQFETRDKDALLAYFQHMLLMIVKDQVPFYSVDIIIPCFPSVKFAQTNLEEVGPLVLNCIRMWL
jgi:hypothetical protein